jgi:restriction endonuclease S subunit
MSSVIEPLDGWEAISLGELTKNTRPICYGVLKPGDYESDGIPLIRIVDIKNDQLLLDSVHRISSQLDEEFSRSRVHGGEVLLSIQGTIGRVAIAPISSAGSNISRTIAIIEPDSRTSARFVRYWLMWARTAGVFKIGGTTRDSLNIGDIRELVLPIPRLKEQEKIVEILEEQISRLDAAIVSVRSARDKAANFRRSLLHAAFTGSLTGHDTSACLLPESWQQSELGKIAKWGSGGTPKSGTRTFYGGEIPWAVIGDLTESWVSETAQTITNAGLEKSSAKIIEPGTVMLAMYGASIGRTGIAAVNMATNQAIAFAVPVDGVMDNQYLLKYIQSQKDDFVRAGQGGAQPNISQTVIKPWPIPVPPIAEQKRIVEILEEQFSRLDAALAVADAIERKISATRRSLLHAAFTGELTKKWREGANV